MKITIPKYELNTKCDECFNLITKEQFEEFDGCCSQECCLNKYEFNSLISAGR